MRRAKDQLAYAVSLGWVEIGRKNGHIKLHHPTTGNRYSLAGSPSDWRGDRNARADLRRGARIPYGKRTNERRKSP